MSIRIGVDYYPEQWEERLWESDADQMQAAGVRMVRMGEFAWSRMEPREGEYSFEWLDRAVQLFAERQIEVVLGTPTCTPPQWMLEKYPQIIQVGKDGKRVSIGIRGHRCLNEPLYREKCRQIITQLVTRYRDNPWVTGYQIDNELEANHCCCPVCEEKFRAFVRDKYQTIEAVNEAWGNVVWSGEYSDFSEIRAPFGEYQTWLNPSYQLDFNRYASESTAEYVAFQCRLIRSLDPKAKLTTNNWFCENMPDFYRLFEPLDVVSYDNYPPTVIPKDSETLYSHAFHLDFMRGIKRQNFWVMEQLSGGLGSWMPMNPTLQPGMLKGYALQAIAHGADAVLHFRWRTAVGGAEMFWHGILDHSNVPGRRYREFCDLCHTVNTWDVPEESAIQNKVAVLYSAEQEYAFKIQPQVEGMHYFTQLKAYHDAFTCLGVGVDIVDSKSDLSAYAVVAAPTMLVTDAALEDNLEKFVRDGGTLILTNRSGVKNEDNRCIMAPLPTVFSRLCGVTVAEYDPIGLTRQRLRIADAWADRFDTAGGSFANLWCDILEPDGAEAVAFYDENFYRGSAAITRYSYERGTTYYVGTVPDRSSLIALCRMIAEETDVEYIDGLPRGVEYTVRGANGRNWEFFFNNTNTLQEFCWRYCRGTKKREWHRERLLPFEMRVQE